MIMEKVQPICLSAIVQPIPIRHRPRENSVHLHNIITNVKRRCERDGSDSYYFMNRNVTRLLLNSVYVCIFIVYKLL